MTTNFYENDLPTDATDADVARILLEYAASTGQYVEVASRTEANQRLAAKGTGNGPLMVLRTDIDAIETHLNTGAPGETWTQQTNRALTAADVAATQGNLQTVLTGLLGDLSALPAFAWGRALVNVIGSRPEVFDTGAIDYATAIGGVNLPFTQDPIVLVGSYISTNGVRVEASIPVVNASGFTIRVKRNGYTAGEVTFFWIALGRS